jgi:archaeal flagellar protein FlaJ
MKFKIPLTTSSLEKQKKTADFIAKRIRIKKKSQLQKNIDFCDIKITREQYLGICIKNFIFNFLFFLLITLSVLIVIKIPNFLIISFGITALISSFIFFIQYNYPKIYSKKREKDIERNLMSALEDMLIQLTSGIPLFSIMVNISASDYGELSVEFKKAIRKMHVNIPEEKVLEEMGESNSSIFFKRTLWQISNGMRAGSDMGVVIEDSIDALSGEQMIQLQNYANKLNPIVMFYMLSSVIIPALSVTFLTIIASMINLGNSTTKIIFISLFVFVMFMQIMFLGLIKSMRPNLL